MQQFRHPLRRRAEPGRQVFECRFVMHRHAGEDDRASRIDLAQQLRQAVRMIDEEMAYPVLLLGGGCRAANADGRHEVFCRIGDDRIDQFNLRQGGAIEMPDARIRQQPEDGPIRIRFDREQYAARKPGEKFPCGLAIDVRIDAIDRVPRALRSQQAGDVFKLFQVARHASIIRAFSLRPDRKAVRAGYVPACGRRPGVPSAHRPPHR